MPTSDFDPRTLDQFRGQHVLVVGDVMVDAVLSTLGSRPSPEFGGPVLAEGPTVSYPGGAAFTALNARTLGAAVTLVGATGIDAEGQLLAHRIQAAGIAFPAARAWATTRKTRVYQDGQVLFRLDRDIQNPIPLSHLLRVLDEGGPFDGLLLSDYQKGAFADIGLLQQFLAAFRAANPQAIVGINAKPDTAAHLGRPVDLLSLNRREYLQLDPFDHGIGRLGRKLGADWVLVTHGAQGATLVEATEPPRFYHSAGHPVAVKDTVGCGDASFAAALLALRVTRNPQAIVEIANAAGAVKATQDGTTPVTARELQQRLFPDVFAGVPHG